MKSFVNSDLQRLAFDAANGIVREGMSKEKINDAIRNAVIEACGGEWNFYSFMPNRYKVFAIMAELTPVATQANLAGKFERFADVRDLALGDKNYFTVEDNKTYPLVTNSRGNQDIERHRIIDRNFTVSTVNKSIKFYDEWDSFVRGKIDFARLAEKASTAMANYIGELIATTIYASYSSLNTNVVNTGAFDAGTLNTMIEHVLTANSAEKVTIYGTRTALSNISDGFGYSDSAKDRANSWGYYGEFRGSDLIALPQSYTAGTENFHVNNDHIIILPTNEKIIKVVLEADVIVNMNDTMSRNDMQQELYMDRKIGAAAITVPDNRFGFYKFS